LASALLFEGAEREVAMSDTRILTAAFYFGLEVYVIWEMEHCSLIQYNGQEIVVHSADLVPESAYRQVA
jgi:hypothetical protein